MEAPKPSPPGRCQNWWLLISCRTKAAVAWRCQSDAGTFLISWGFPIGLGERCPSFRWDAGGPQSACGMCWKQFAKWLYASSRLEERDSWGNIHHCQDRRNSVSPWQPCTLRFYSPVLLEVQKEVCFLPCTLMPCIHPKQEMKPSSYWSCGV